MFRSLGGYPARTTQSHCVCRCRIGQWGYLPDMEWNGGNIASALLQALVHVRLGARLGEEMMTDCRLSAFLVSCVGIGEHKSIYTGPGFHDIAMWEELRVLRAYAGVGGWHRTKDERWRGKNNLYSSTQTASPTGTRYSKTVCWYECKADVVYSII